MNFCYFFKAIGLLVGKLFLIFRFIWNKLRDSIESIEYVCISGCVAVQEMLVRYFANRKTLTKYWQRFSFFVIAFQFNQPCLVIRWLRLRSSCSSQSIGRRHSSITGGCWRLCLLLSMSLPCFVDLRQISCAKSFVVLLDLFPSGVQFTPTFVGLNCQLVSWQDNVCDNWSGLSYKSPLVAFSSVRAVAVFHVHRLFAVVATQAMPSFVELVLERLTREILTTELRTMCLQVTSYLQPLTHQLITGKLCQF